MSRIDEDLDRPRSQVAWALWFLASRPDATAKEIAAFFVERGIYVTTPPNTNTVGATLNGLREKKEFVEWADDLDKRAGCRPHRITAAGLAAWHRHAAAHPGVYPSVKQGANA